MEFSSNNTSSADDYAAELAKVGSDYGPAGIAALWQESEHRRMRAEKAEQHLEGMRIGLSGMPCPSECTDGLHTGWMEGDQLRAECFRHPLLGCLTEPDGSDPATLR